MSAPRYPGYKDSGVAWLGQVPSHWHVRPFKWEIDRNDGGVWGDDPDGADDTIVLRSTEQTVDGHWRMDDPAPRKLSKTERAVALLAEGDLVVTKSSGSSLHIGKTTIVTAEIAATGCCYSNFMQRIRTRATFLPKLAWYVMNNDLARLQFDLASNSTTGLANLNGTTIGGIVLPVPPAGEQVSMIAFLDRETTKIDALVEEQRRLIELLKEKRQAVISRAVTKGLNPNTPMKDSRVEWLGQVPVHWTVGAVKRFFSVLDGRRIPLSSEERGSKGGEFPYYGASGVIDWIDEFIFDEDLVLVSEDGANLLNRATPIAFVATGKYWVNNHAHILRPLDGNLVFWAARIETIDLTPFVTGSAQPKLTIEALGNLMIAVPPDEAERLAIERHVVEEAGKLDALMKEAADAMQLLQERRSAIISAAVTGKIDVRGLVPQSEAVPA